MWFKSINQIIIYKTACNGYWEGKIKVQFRLHETFSDQCRLLANFLHRGPIYFWNHCATLYLITLKVATNNVFTCVGLFSLWYEEPSEIIVWIQYRAIFSFILLKKRYYFADFPEAMSKTCPFIKSLILSYLMSFGHTVPLR